MAAPVGRKTTWTRHGVSSTNTATCAARRNSKTRSRLWVADWPCFPLRERPGKVAQANYKPPASHLHGSSKPPTSYLHATLKPTARWRKYADVAQTSKSAVSPTSQSAGRRDTTHVGGTLQHQRVWKPAIRSEED